MLDGITLDQLRTFIAAVDEGSFSAAGRKLRRAQSVISQRWRIWKRRSASSSSIVLPATHSSPRKAGAFLWMPAQ